MSIFVRLTYYKRLMNSLSMPRQLNLYSVWMTLIMINLLTIFHAQARVGDWGDPIEIVTLPFVHRSDTDSRTDSQVDRYDCASHLSESGSEVIYRLNLTQSGTLLINVEGDNGHVDIDVHLLDRMQLNGSEAQGCINRNNRAIEQSVSAGEYFITVDTYDGQAQAGPYRLLVNFEPEGEWYSRPIANGVTLETKRYNTLFGDHQFGSVIRVDLNEPGVEIRPVQATGCQTTSQLARSVGAVAAINGGYFDGSCGSVSLLKINGQLLSTNARSRSAFGMTAQGLPHISWIAAGFDWPEVHQAVGGLSRLASSGSVNVEWERDQATYGFAHYAHPRTGIAIADGNEVILATLDGRTAAGAGVSLFDFGQWLVWLGAQEALNLDGGGSTTLWTSTEGIVNYPSDNGYADHYGERGVSNILAVFAPALNRAVEWIIPHSNQHISTGEQVRYDIFARDPDGGDISLEVMSNGRGIVQLTERGDGSAILIYNAAFNDIASVTISLIAYVNSQIDGRYPLTLNITDGDQSPSGGEMSGDMEISAGMEMSGGIDTSAGMEISGDMDTSAGMEISGDMDTSAGIDTSAGTSTSQGGLPYGGQDMNGGMMSGGHIYPPQGGNSSVNPSSPNQMDTNEMVENQSSVFRPQTTDIGSTSCQQKSSSKTSQWIFSILFIFAFIRQKNTDQPSLN